MKKKRRFIYILYIWYDTAMVHYTAYDALTPIVKIDIIEDSFLRNDLEKKNILYGRKKNLCFYIKN